MQVSRIEGNASDGLVGQLRDVLSHLYDYAFLTDHRLSAAFQAATPGERMRRLRMAVLEGIEHLQRRCGPGVAAHLRRSYEVLDRHYVQGMTVMEVAHELGISRRQAYRSLRQAERDLAVVMAGLFAPVQAAEHTMAPPAGQAVALTVSQTADGIMQQEIARAASAVASTPVAELLAAAVAGVGNLAAERQVTIAIDAICEASLRTAVAPARQAVLYALSAVTQAAIPHTTVQVRAAMQAGQAAITLRAQCGDTDPDLRNPRELLASIDGSCHIVSCDSALEVMLYIPVRSPLTLLVIDDNPGMIELFARYLDDGDHRLYGETDLQRAIGRIAELHPDVIILDVMMPYRDGWHVLQQLRGSPDTCATPVIVCSVLDDPALALSLGASAFLAKPVTRAALLAALASLPGLA